jgi:copper chaperone CopZ
MSAEIPALGCGEGRLLSDQPATCPVGMFECWMTCMDVSAFQDCNGGMWRPSGVGMLAEYVNLSVQCVHLETGLQWPDETGQMCYGCGPKCGFTTVAAPTSSMTGTASSTEDDGVFCRTTFMGTGVTMYMDGFKMTSGSPDETCVSFLLPSLVIDKHWKLVVASLGVVLMSASVEISSLGRRFLPKERQGDVGIIFHVISLTLAYTAMLFVMTYSVELFVSVILGLALGHVVAGTLARRLKASKVGEADTGAGSLCCRLSSGLDLAPANSGESTSAKSVADAGAEPTSMHGMYVEDDSWADEVPVRQTTVRLSVKGMSSSSCTEKVRRALEGVEGVHSAKVNLQEASADVLCKPSGASVQMLCEASSSVGFDTREASSSVGVEL